MESSQQPAQAPTIGRVVRFIGGSEPGVEAREYPAIINTTIAEDPGLGDRPAVSLTIFDPRGTYEVSGVMECPPGDPKPGCWCWPVIHDTTVAASPPVAAGGEPAAETDDGIPLYSTEHLPAEPTFSSFRKVALTSAARLEGPFRVQTSESENEPFYCQDGYLAIDSRGYPYAIAVDEFEQIYEPALPKELADELAVLRDGLDKQDPADSQLSEAIDAWLNAKREGGVEADEPAK